MKQVLRQQEMTECDMSRSVFIGPCRTVGEAWIQLKKSLHDEAEVHLKFSNKVKLTLTYS